MCVKVRVRGHYRRCVSWHRRVLRFKDRRVFERRREDVEEEKHQQTLTLFPRRHDLKRTWMVEHHQAELEGWGECLNLHIA